MPARVLTCSFALLTTHCNEPTVPAIIAFLRLPVLRFSPLLLLPPGLHLPTILSHTFPFCLTHISLWVSSPSWITQGRWTSYTYLCLILPATLWVYLPAHHPRCPSMPSAFHIALLLLPAVNSLPSGLPPGLSCSTAFVNFSAHWTYLAFELSCCVPA